MSTSIVRLTAIGAIAILARAALVTAADAATDSRCAALAAHAPADTRILSATAIAPPPAFVSPSSDLFGGTTVATPFCRVVGVIKPAIGFELWLPPAAQWDGRFRGIGNGGMGGAIDYPGLAQGLARGSATAATDSGHVGSMLDGSFAIGHPQLVIDWGYRAVHATTVAAKALVAAYYGRAPGHSYFTGCSGGGRQALMEAQRYPADYDGIVAGDPTNDFTHLTTAGRLWAERAILVPADAYIPADKLPALAAAVLRRCDRQDGVADGIIADPRTCRFDPAVLLCRAGDRPDCLTAPQVAAVRKIYAGARTGSGRQIFPGYEPGGELGPGGWTGAILGRHPEGGYQWFYASGFLQGMVYENRAYDPLSFDFEKDMPKVDGKLVLGEKLADVINAASPDLDSFRARGGKLIQYHGWNDPGVPALNSVNYYEAVVARLRADTAAAPRPAQSFYRLFLAPGMQHCGGGPGPNAFGGLAGSQPDVAHDPDHDLYAAITRWVERGQAPDRLIATKYLADDPKRGAAMTRPLCPYPQQARYQGSGSTADAGSFTCGGK